MSFLALAATALTLGFLHGLGADHLMAIASLAVSGRSGDGRARVMPTAVGFAVGHAGVLGLGAIAAVAFGLALPVGVAAGAESVGGALLVTFGAVGLWGVLAGRTYSHIHSETDGRTRWHVHLGLSVARPHAAHPHSRLPTVVGALFAVSSLRALMLLQPFGLEARALAVPALLLLIALFGLGILTSMSIFGVVLARVLSLRAVQVLGRTAALLVAVASVALGAYWIVR